MKNRRKKFRENVDVLSSNCNFSVQFQVKKVKVKVKMHCSWKADAQRRYMYDKITCLGPFLYAACQKLINSAKFEFSNVQLNKRIPKLTKE